MDTYFTASFSSNFEKPKHSTVIRSNMVIIELWWYKAEGSLAVYS